MSHPGFRGLGCVSVNFSSFCSTAPQHSSIEIGGLIQIALQKSRPDLPHLVRFGCQFEPGFGLPFVTRQPRQFSWHKSGQFLFWHVL